MDNENVEEERRAQNLEDDEISLIDLLAVLLRYKWLIIITTGVAMIFAVAFSAISIVLPNVDEGGVPRYTARAMMFINTENQSSKSLSSMLSASGLATDFVETDSFLDSVVDEFDLSTRFGMEGHPHNESRAALKSLLVVDFDNKASVLSLCFTDEDPEFAKNVVDFSVRQIESMLLNLGIDKNILEKENLEQTIEKSYKEILNLQKKIQSLESSVSYGSSASMTEAAMVLLELEVQKEVYTQLKTQYELLKVKMARETPIFQVIQVMENAKMSGNKFRKGVKLCIIITFAAFFFSTFIAFALNAVENVRKDPETMEKLRSAIKF